MKKLIKSSLYLTSIGLVGAVAFDVLFLIIAKKCQPIFLSSMDIMDKCQYTMIGLSMWTQYVFLPIIVLSFLFVIIPALISLKKKQKIENFHTKMIVYAILAFLIGKYLVHFALPIFF